MKLSLKASLTVVAAALSGINALAVPLGPGGALPALPEADPIGGIVLASMPVAFIGNPGPNQFTGVLTSTVINDLANPLGGLTFTYQIQNTTPLEPGDVLHRLTIEGFGSFLTDVSFNPFSGGTQPPFSIDRSANGDVLGFSFTSFPPFGIDPGETTLLMVVQTSAHQFAIADANVIDGATANTIAFAPAQVPDGGTTSLLLGASFLGAVAIRRKLS